MLSSHIKFVWQLGIVVLYTLYTKKLRHKTILMEETEYKIFESAEKIDMTPDLGHMM